VLKIVAEVHAKFQENGQVAAEDLSAIAHYQKEIVIRIREQCLKEAKGGDRFELVNLGIDDVIEAGAHFAGGMAPGAGLAHKGLACLGRVLSRKSTSMKWADFTLSPIETYATRLQKRIAGRPS
jgi:hypothetical protein